MMTEKDTTIPKPVSQDPKEELNEYQNLGSSSDANHAFYLEDKKKTDTKKDTVVGTKTGFEEQTLNKKTREGKPFIKNQLTNYPDSCEISRVENFVLDLSNNDDLNKLNSLETASIDENGGLIIQEKEKQFYEGRWMVFLNVAHLQFSTIM